MNLSLVRSQFIQDGIFGSLKETNGDDLYVTLEHAYPNVDTWTSKLPDGGYKCLRGLHQLAGMSAPFETFEVLDVPGHTGILFHIGNYNADSSGCILLGDSIVHGPSQSMITNSHLTFMSFMILQQGTSEFLLQVSSLS